MIKQIYFDAGKVIFTRRTPDGDHIAELLGFPKDNYNKILQNVIDSQSPEENNKFWSIKTLDDEYRYLNEFHEKMCKYLNHEYDNNLITKLSECRIKADFIVNDGVIETIKALSKKYKLSILSNALPSRRYHELLLDNLISYFDPVIISFEVGMHKPDSKIFEYALSLSEFRPSEIAFVDDNLKNIQTAKKMGFGQCILFSNSIDSDFKSTTDFRKLVDLIE